jgi:inner membrane protein
MASFGHVAVGLAAGRFQARGGGRLRSVLVLTALSMFPDADVVTWWMGIGRHSIWLHRGALHSLVVSVVAAVAGALLLDRRRGFGGAFLTCLATAVSHPLLDTVTHGGSGVMLFWPLSDARFLAPWHPLPAAPIGLRLLSPHGLGLLAREALLFAPLVLYALWPRRRATRDPVPRAS